MEVSTPNTISYGLLALRYQGHWRLFPCPRTDWHASNSFGPSFNGAVMGFTGVVKGFIGVVIDFDGF